MMYDFYSLTTMWNFNDYFCTRLCWVLLLSTMPSTSQAHATTVHSPTAPVTQGSAKKLDLTALEGQLLSTYLNASSDQEQLLKLIGALSHAEVAVRDAASNAIDQILTANPKLADEKTLSVFQETFKEKYEQACAAHASEFFELMGSVNHGLVPALIDVLTEALERAGKFINDDESSDRFRRYLSAVENLLASNPTCIKEILASIKKDIKTTKDVVRTRAVRTLSTILAHKPLLTPDSEYVSDIFKIASSMIEDKSSSVRVQAIYLLSRLAKVSRQYLDTARKAAKKAMEDTDEHIRRQGVRTVMILSTSAYFYPEDLRSVLDAIIKATEDRNSRIHSTAITCLLMLSRKEKFETEEEYQAFIKRIVPIAIRGARDDGRYVRNSALYLISAVVSADSKYAAQLLPTVLTSINDDMDNRALAVDTLGDILQVQPSCAKNRTVRKALEAASHDDRQEVREKATALMEQYGIE